MDVAKSQPAEDIVEEPPIDNVKGLIKKFAASETFEPIDMLDIADDSDDMLCDFAKLATWI